MAQKLKVNDIVSVISGDNKGAKAKIVKIDREAHRAYLEGIEVRERHLKRSYLNPTGGRKTVQQGIDLSNLKLEEAYKYQKAKSTKKTTKSAKNTKKGAK